MRITATLTALAMVVCTAGAARADEPGAPLPVPDEPAARQKQEAEGETTWQEIAGWTGIGLGGAALLTGLIFAGLASQKDSEYEEGVELLRTFDELDELNNKGTQYNSVMVAGIVSGLVVAVLGGHLLVWDKAERASRRSAAQGLTVVAPMVTRGGVGLSAVARF